MRRFIEGFLSIPLLFAIITILAYGLLLPFTGFYWDDWPFAWIAHFLGPAEFIPAFASFRPFLGPIFFLTTSLIPTVPIYWQIFALIIRFLLVLTTWWMFKSIWPNHPRSALGASLLVLIFPGYSQHWVALTHINQELIPLIFYFLSFGFTARVVRSVVEPDPGGQINSRSKQSRFFPLTVAAILLQICGLFPTEYFFGLEIMRLLFIFAILTQFNIVARFIQALRYWLPYLAVWLLNAIWLMYYYNSGVYASYDTAGLQTPSIQLILVDLLDTIWKTGFYIWIQIIDLLARSPSLPSSILAMVLLVLSFVLLYIYLSRFQFQESRSKAFGPQLLIIGLAGILAGRLPSLAAGLPLKLQSSYDRFMVSIFLGGSLFAVGILETLIRNNRIRIVLLALLVSLGIGQQFFNANIFRRDWEKQGQIYWQLSWRIPGLQPNTVLLTHQMPIDYETDLSFTAPINWLYAPDYQNGTLPFAMLYTEKRLGGPTLPALEPGIRINFPYRTVEFDGNTSQAIVLYMPPSGCLRLLDPDKGDAVTYQRESRYLVEAIPLSDTDRILTEDRGSVKPFFIREPEKDWCFYYTHAELARQQGDWQKIMTLWDEALTQGYSPSDPVEYLPFVEAAARSDDFKMVETMTKIMTNGSPSAHNALCVLWNRLLEDTTIDNATRSSIRLQDTGLNCAP